MGEEREVRIGDREREAALAALEQHHAEGRLDAFEYEDRRGRVHDAVTRADLEEVFTDLPDPRPPFDASGTLGADASGRQPGPTRPAEVARAQAPSGLARALRVLVPLSPFIALVAFFELRTWLVFLLIPALAVLSRSIDER